ncbi:hypothetical protein [Amycolatopsis sp. NPDC051102]|uniref:hypothetical protein n=1 Tax=Amycolatopsis sp. NPDC051102 TaxID=3155163 RepID=UPI003446874F
MALSDFFHVNPQIGKNAAQLDSEIREVAAETRKRVLNHNDTEDQEARTHFLREARGRLN